MWEVIFGVIPLIFICSAITLMIINVDAVLQYLIYTLTNALRKKYASKLSYEPTPTETDSNSNQKPHFSLLQLLQNIFLRLFNLFTAIFLPKIPLDLSFFNESKLRNDSEHNYITQIAQHHAKQLNIKSYSAIPTSLAKSTTIYPNPSTKPTLQAREDTIYAPLASQKTILTNTLLLLKRALYYLALSTPLLLIATIITLYILKRSTGLTSSNLLEWLTNEITTFTERYLSNPS